MYRHLNLRTGPDNPGGLLGIMKDDGEVSNYSRNPPGFPDAVNSNDWIVQMHGFNVSGERSRGWESEVFKELYWSHSHDKFVWGCVGSVIRMTLQTICWPTTRQPFKTHLFPGKLWHVSLTPRLTGGNVTTISHSLSSMVVSSAIADYSMNVTHAIFVDGAVATEAFDGNTDVDPGNMALSSWYNGSNSTAIYPTQLWSANWWSYAFNGTSDARGNLTWAKPSRRCGPQNLQFLFSHGKCLGDQFCRPHDGYAGTGL